MTAAPRYRMRAARRALLGLTVAAGVLSSSAGVASASSSDDEVEHYDARVQGYTPTAESKSSSVGMVWVLLVLLCGGTVGVMFMDAKRSHLD